MGGTGGAAGTGGTSGAGGTGGTGGAGGGGGSGPLDVAAGLDGQMFLAPCMRDQDPTVCSTFSGTCPNTTIADVALRGALLTDKTVILGGTPGTSYAITLHIQGEVEAKEYTGATDQNSTATSPMADGFAVDGTPSMSNAYGVYMLRVTNPGATTKTDYFLNSLIPPGKSDHTTYAVDYFATINAQAGATIRLVAADSNCSQMKNCGPLGSGDLCRAPIVFSNVEPSAKASNPSFDFTAAYNGQWLVLTVTGVSSL